MPIIHTDTLSPSVLSSMSHFQSHQIYNGLDCCVTEEVRGELESVFPNPPLTYQFERAMQGPYLEMMMRGFAIDEVARREAADTLHGKVNYLLSVLNEFSAAVWDKPLNPASPAQLKKFFFEAMELPEVWINQKGERKVSTNREALEKLECYLYAKPFVNIILTIRDLTKQLQVFETEIDSDGRFRTSYNIAGTETGRPSSSTNAFGTGSNLQNINKDLRYVFVADKGYRVCNIDLEQTEARDVGLFCGLLFNDWKYLDACEAGDVHTRTTRLVWPEMPWTGDIKKDRQIADRHFYRHMSFRDMAKRGSHLSNYSGTAYTAARALKVPLKLVEEFQARYCRPELAKKYNCTTAYPAISKWWQWVATELQTKQYLTTPFGRKRHFFSRPDDPTTLREAIAFLPQSTTADRMNLGMHRVWEKMPEVELLAQTYDSITFQYREELDENEIVEKAMELIRVELSFPNRPSYIVPGDAEVGWNWGHHHNTKQPCGPGNRYNPDGMLPWSPGMVDKRERTGK